MITSAPTPAARLVPRASARGLAVGAATLAVALGLSTVAAVPASAAPPTQTIAAVQGTTDVSPLVGTTQTVEGVVTADYRGASGYNGVVVQTAGSGGAADATPGASDGIFVYLDNVTTAAALGDKVTVTGAVSEFRGLTQISATGAAGVEVVLPAAEVPAAEVPAAAPLADTVVGAARETLESQLVVPAGSYRVSSSFQLFNFGTLWLSAGAEAPVKSTETVDAADPANAQIAAANRANRILLDDGYNAQVTAAAHIGEQPYFAAGAVVRTGDTVTFPARPYVLSYGFDDWRLQPTVAITDASPADYKPTFAPTNPRTVAPAEVGGDFSVGAFNVFNYFTTLTSENSAARGADTAAQLAIQRSKIVAAINGLDADVVSLMEIENSIKLGKPVDSALADLVAGLNDAAGAGTWSYVPTPAELSTSAAAATTDFITNAIIYKTASATPVGASFTQLDETVWGNAREPIAQTFEVDGKVMTVVANHFKSKSGSGTEPADGQGFFNADRTAQAQAVLALTQSISADPAKGADILLLGDFNAYAQEDPIQVFTAAGMVDVLPTETDGQYTYEFNGELGSLDHAIASPSLAADITGATAWTINSPEWSDRGFAYGATEAGTPFRSSDHDPIKVGVSATPLPVNIDLVTTNDFHGRLEAAPPVAGAAVLGGMVDFYEAQNPNTLFVGAGDLIGASTFTSFIQNDQPTIDVLNEIGLDASALGNHEFDQGTDDLRDRVIPAADWPYLSANVYEAGTDDAAFDEYWTQEFDGVTVGFVGAVTEDLPSLVSPAGIVDIEVGEVVPAVNRVADQLSDGDAANGEADVVVLLVHEGATTPAIESSTDDSAFGRIVNGVDANVDAIVSAHTHLPYSHLIPVAGTDKVRPVISAGQYGERYGHLDLSVDPETGELLDITAEVLPLAGAFPPDPEVAAIVADAVAVATVAGSVKVGNITGDFNRAVQPVGGENRGGESTLGNFVADVQKWATTDAGSDLALMNPGGLRSDLKFATNATTPGDGPGVVTFAEAAGVQPFANTLVAMDLTTAQLKAVLEEQWQPAGSTRPFLKLGVSDSFEYTYDPAGAAGDRIDAMYVDGALATEGDTFRVTVNSFLAAGGDNFTTLAEGTNRQDTGRVDLQSMVDFFKAFPVAEPDFSQRAVGVSLSPAAAEGGYVAGEQVTLTLSSLLFSTGGPTGGEVTVSLGDTVLGSAPVDPTIIQATDEGGRATVTITIPEGVSGPLVLDIKGPQVGSSIGVPIEVAEPVVEDLPNANIAPPVITGQARVGSTLTASGGTWESGAATTYAFQWNRDGAPIAGATGSTYAVTVDDAGSALSVTVVASAEGYLDGTATSAEVTVAKIASAVYGSPSRLLVFGDQRLTYSAVVVANGVTPTGDVEIYDGTRKIATGTVDDNGRVRVTLPRLSRGIHLLTARYVGDDRVASSIGFPGLVLVF